jgi:hypothetical protein
VFGLAIWVSVEDTYENRVVAVHPQLPYGWLTEVTCRDEL